MKADLHVHSIYSDGKNEREEVLAKAQKKGLTHIAFSDHDTTVGAFDMPVLAAQYGITAFPAVEISAYDKATGKKVHVLGYCFKTTEQIDKVCKKPADSRHEASMAQIETLQQLGYEIVPEDVLHTAKAGTLYKQQLLQHLAATGQSDDVFGDAYEKHFKKGGACVQKVVYASAVKAVQAIVADGGVACLAHPGQQQNYELVETLVEAGLTAIEYAHPSHTEEDHKIIKELAEKHGLLLSGGSDYHGGFSGGEGSLAEYQPTEAFLNILLNH